MMHLWDILVMLEPEQAMPLRNHDNGYGYLAIGFHWLIAALFLCMIAMGLVMTSLPRGHEWTFPLFQWHKSIGITILALASLRLMWRLVNPQPAPPPLSALERSLMHLTHYGLYLALFLMPLTGWVVVSSSSLGLPTILYGVLRLPHLGFIATSPYKSVINDWAGAAHEVLAWSALALIALHSAAALYHHLVRRDDVLRRMLVSRQHQQG